jgi:hypothetical protein
MSRHLGNGDKEWLRSQNLAKGIYIPLEVVSLVGNVVGNSLLGNYSLATALDLCLCHIRNSGAKQIGCFDNPKATAVLINWI